MTEEDIAERMSRIAIVSSGDPEKDRRELREAAIHQIRIDQDLCPNGCGHMIWDDPHNSHCPICHFACFCSQSKKITIQ